jgi:hypothetical protein
LANSGLPHTALKHDNSQIKTRCHAYIDRLSI